MWLFFLFNKPAGGILSYPETGHHSSLKGRLNLLQQLGLLLFLRPLSLLLHHVKLHDAGWVIQVHPDGAAVGNVPDFHVVAVEPQLIGRPTPTQTPGVLVLSQPAGPVASPPACPFVDNANNHPSGVFHLPVGSEVLDAFFAKNLLVEKRDYSDFSYWFDCLNEDVPVGNTRISLVCPEQDRWHYPSCVTLKMHRQWSTAFYCMSFRPGRG